MLVNIQLLRCIAAMLVVMYHTAAHLPPGSEGAHGLFWFGQAVGYAGVDIFFVISGFIMAYTTLNEDGWEASTDFIKRRLGRIFSGYWPFFFLALGVFWFARPAHVAESNLLASFFLWPQRMNRVLLEITWTLSYELYFYLLFALLILLVPRRIRPGLCLAVTATIGLASLYRHFVSQTFTGDNLYLIPLAVDFLASPFLLEFFAGTLIAYYLTKRSHGTALAWLLPGVLLFAGGSLVNQFGFGGNLEQGFHVVPRVMLFGTASVLIVTGLVRLESRGVVAPRSFSIQTGGASYAVYLSHIPLLMLAAHLGLPAWAATLPSTAVSIIYMGLMGLILALSVLHYNRLERPLHRLFKRWLGVRKAPAAQAHR